MATSRFRHYSLLASRAVRLAAVLHLIHTRVCEFTPVAGLSMLPTFQTAGDFVFVDKLHHRYGLDIKVGDVVVIKKPTALYRRMNKRVAALPGDIVYCNETPSYEVTANSITVEEELQNARTGKYIRVPEGHVWVLGDNSVASYDSRMFGPVPLALIVGRVSHAVFYGPFNVFPDWPRQVTSNMKPSDRKLSDILSEQDEL